MNQLATTVPLTIISSPQILYFGVKLSPVIDSIITDSTNRFAVVAEIK